MYINKENNFSIMITFVSHGHGFPKTNLELAQRTGLQEHPDRGFLFELNDDLMKVVLEACFGMDLGSGFGMD